MPNRISWSVIESNYPNMWAFMTNVRRDNGNIVDCELLCVVPFEKMADTMAQLKNKGILFERERTTESMPTTGVIL